MQRTKDIFLIKLINITYTQTHMYKLLLLLLIIIIIKNDKITKLQRQVIQ